MDSYFTKNVSDIVTGKLLNVKTNMRRYFPAPELNRSKWKEIRQSNDEVELANIAAKYGQKRSQEWALENMQKDIEGVE